MSNRRFTFLIIGIVVLAITVVLLFDNGFFGGRNQVAQKEQELQESTVGDRNRAATENIPDGFEFIGGIPRPVSDMQTRKRTNGPNYRNSTELLGKIKTIAAETNANTKSVAEAFQKGKNPERLSSMIAPKPFNAEAFKKDPQKYLDTIEPGRIWQTRPVGKAPPIKRVGGYSQKIIRGETITLRTEVAPGSPVNFYSQKLGSFPNKLTSITVRADENGFAETQFTASERTKGLVTVLASSPMHSHQARFLVQVELPNEIPKVD